VNEHGIATFTNIAGGWLNDAVASQRLSGGSSEEIGYQARARIAGARRNSPEVRARGEEIEIPETPYLSFFPPMQAVFCARAATVPMGQLLASHSLRNLPSHQALRPINSTIWWRPWPLYPDPLVSQILVASTYPLELVQALAVAPAKPEPHRRRPDPSGRANKTGTRAYRPW